jgi:acyl-CoA reductase-like NAD-dependent aldehyde dehydrogenase
MIENRIFIQNEWKKTTDSIESINPATLETVGQSGSASSEDCMKAVQAAKEAHPEWREIPIRSKKAVFKKAKEILLKKSLETGRLITLEKGSPLPESMSSEVMSSLEALDYYIHSMDQLLQPKNMRHNVILFFHKKGLFHFQSLGPMLVISPWNFPFMIPFLDILAGLTAGNTLVMRPSSTTPFCGLHIGEIFEEAGLPPGVLNIVPSRTQQAEEMIRHPDFHLISFTGSTSTGKRVMELASRNLTNVNLELGGKDPMIVLKDADLDKAAYGAVWGAFMNCGQSCGSIERVYADRDIIDSFIEKITALTKNLRVGDPRDEGIDIGPMVTLSQLELVEEHIKDAREKGAEVFCGGERIHDLSGYFIRPAVLSKVNHSMMIMKEETFGPVLPVMPFSSLDEAAALANDSDFGLTASVWTESRKNANYLTSKIESGTVTINDHMTTFSEPGAIWGGIKQSGIGRCHGPIGFKDLVYVKYVSQDFSKKKHRIWWYPYDKGLLEVLNKSFPLFYSNRLGQKFRSMMSLTPYLSRIKKGIPLSNFIKGLPRLLRK